MGQFYWRFFYDIRCQLFKIGFHKTRIILLRETIFIIALLLVFVFLFVAYRKPHLAGYTIPAILWLVNLGAFVLSRMIMTDAQAYEHRILLNQWSQIVQLHALFSVGGLAALTLWDDVIKLLDRICKLTGKLFQSRL